MTERGQNFIDTRRMSERKNKRNGYNYKEDKYEVGNDVKTTGRRGDREERRASG